jgi:autotransporter-associated beta strand protein
MKQRTKTSRHAAQMRMRRKLRCGLIATAFLPAGARAGPVYLNLVVNPSTTAFFGIPSSGGFSGTSTRSGAGTWQLFVLDTNADSFGINNYSLSLVGTLPAINHRSPQTSWDDVDNFGPYPAGFASLRTGTNANPITAAQPLPGSTPVLIGGYGQTASNFTAKIPDAGSFSGTTNGLWGNYATVTPAAGKNWLFLAEGTYTGAAPTVNLGSSSVSIYTSPGFTSSRNSALLAGVPLVGNWFGTSSANWDTGGNWSDGAEPTSTIDVVFPTPVPASGSTIAMTSGEAARTITFNDSYTLSGGDLTLSNGTIAVNSSAATIFSTLAGSAALTKTGTGTLTLSSAYSHPAALTTISAGKLTTIASFSSAALANSGQLDSIGTTLTFPGASTNSSAAKISLIDATLNLGSGGNKLTNSGRINLIDCTVNGDILSNAGGVINTAGNVTFNGSITGGASLLSVSDGVTTLGASGVRVAAVSVLSLAGTLDLKDNKLIVTAPASTGSWNGSAYTGTTGLIVSGRGGGLLPLWDGNGIITSQSNATAGNYHSIGIAKASDVRPATATATALWAGQTITGSDTLIMYTYGGDATLDGKINIDDYVKIDSGIAGGYTGWVNGDFNYDGKVSIDDYITVIDANIGNQSGTFPTGEGIAAGGGNGVTFVPEPVTAALLILPALAMLQRQRSRLTPAGR